VLKGPNLQHFHLIEPKQPIKIGTDAHLIVDPQIRDAASKNHSVEHLLQHALQTVIDKNIKQEGAFKSADKLSFDFILPNKLTPEQIKLVQKQVNEYIHQALPITTNLQTLAEAKQSGAIAYFEDVYAKIKTKLRVVNMGGLSIEICGGTHVKNTKNIEAFMITKYFNKGGGAWRIEGITSHNTIERFINQEISEMQSHILTMAQELKAISVAPTEFEKIVNDKNFQLNESTLDNLKTQYENLKAIYTNHMIEHQKQSMSQEIEKIKSTTKIPSHSKVVSIIILNNVNIKSANQALTQLANENQNMAFVILNMTQEKIQYLVITNKITNGAQKLSAKSIVSDLNKITNGSGGGRDEFAQGGTSNLNTLEQIKDYLLKL
jgi:alanyl-tRNA synthetase